MRRKPKQQPRAWVVLRKPHDIDRMQEFLNLEIVAIGWPGERFYGMDYDDIYRILKRRWHSGSQSVLTKRAKAIDEFVNQMNPGDLVLVPCGNEVYVGNIAGKYFHDSSKDSEELAYPNQRPVKWWSREPKSKQVLPPKIQSALRLRFPPVNELPLPAEQIVASLERRRGSPNPTTTAKVTERSLNPRPIGYKDEKNYASFRKKAEIQVERIHNKLINAFRRAIGSLKKVDESDYDVLIRGWHRRRALLIEAKSKINGGAGRHQVREAIGQLFDYRYMLSRKGLEEMDLAILVPDEPSAEIMELVYKELGIELIWRYGRGFRGTPRVQQWMSGI